MKKTLMTLVLVGAVVAGVFAGGAKDTVTVEGKLVFTDSEPTIVSGNKTWIIPEGPFYQVAYENNIKAGDTLKVEGYENDCLDETKPANTKMIMPTKVSVNGKALDLTKYDGRGGMMGGRGGDRDGMMNGQGGRGGMMGGRGGRGGPAGNPPAAPKTNP